MFPTDIDIHFITSANLFTITFTEGPQKQTMFLDMDGMTALEERIEWALDGTAAPLLRASGAAVPTVIEGQLDINDMLNEESGNEQRDTEEAG